MKFLIILALAMASATAQKQIAQRAWSPSNIKSYKPLKPIVQQTQLPLQQATLASLPQQTRQFTQQVQAPMSYKPLAQTQLPLSQATQQTQQWAQSPITQQRSFIPQQTQQVLSGVQAPVQQQYRVGQASQVQQQYIPQASQQFAQTRQFNQQLQSPAQQMHSFQAQQGGLQDPLM
jgi:hypothetical protein